jgi:hypothetical protein
MQVSDFLQDDKSITSALHKGGCLLKHQVFPIEHQLFNTTSRKHAASSSKAASMRSMIRSFVSAGAALAQRLGIVSSPKGSRENTSVLAPTDRASKKRKAEEAISSYSEDVDAFLSLQRPLAEEMLRHGGGLSTWLFILPPILHPLAVSAATEREKDGSLTLLLDANAHDCLHEKLLDIADAARQLNPPVQALLANGFRDAGTTRSITCITFHDMPCFVSRHSDCCSAPQRTLQSDASSWIMLCIHWNNDCM